MATHSSVLAWRIPGTGEPDWLPSMGSHRVGHDWSDLAAAAAGLQYTRFPITNSWSLLKLKSIELVMPSTHLILCCPLLLLPSVFPSIRVFSNESVLRIRWPKYWSFSFSISPSNEYSGLISFRIDWFDLLAVQGTLKSLLQRYSSKASILQCSAFFMVKLSHSYMTTRKTIALTRRTSVSKVMSPLFNMLSFLPRRKHLLTSWFQSPYTVIFLPWEPHKQYEKSKRYDTERWTP